MDEYLAEIRLFAGNFEPRGWMFCNGRELPIRNYQALFSLLGTTYGGDGRTTFRLPDLRGRVPVGAGYGPGLTPRFPGEIGGAEQERLTVAQIPAHSHSVTASTAAGSTANAPNAIYAVSDGGNDAPAYTTAAPNAALAPDVLSEAGGGQAHTNLQPALGLNYIICVMGYYPSRN